MLHITVQSRNGSLYRIREDNISIYNICAPEMSTKEDDTSKWWFFKISGQLMRDPLIKLFQLFNLLQYWMTIEWLTLRSLAISCVVVRRSALMMLSIGQCQLLMAGHYAHLQGFRLLATLLEPPLYHMFTSSSWAKCIGDFVSCLCYFMTHFELK